jgi:hypothetical protein
MGLSDTEGMDNEKEFMGGLTEFEYFERLNYQRTHFLGHK